jgi:hypothetical protein
VSINSRASDEPSVQIQTCRSCYTLSALHSKWKKNNYEGYDLQPTLRTPKVTTRNIAVPLVSPPEAPSMNGMEVNLSKCCIVRTSALPNRDRKGMDGLEIWRGMTITKSGVPHKVMIGHGSLNGYLTAPVPEVGTWEMQKIMGCRVITCDPSKFGIGAMTYVEEYLGDFMAMTRELELGHIYIDFSDKIIGIGNHLQICRPHGTSDTDMCNSVFKCINILCRHRELQITDYGKLRSRDASGILTPAAVRDMGRVSPIVSKN